MPERGSKKTTDEKQTPQQSRTFSGVIRTLDAKSLDLETTDTRILSIQISDKTTKPAELKIGDGVDVEATQDKDGLFQAVSIQPNAAVAKKIDASDSVEAEGRTAAPPTILVRPGPLYDEGDAGPPKLKRGVPADYAPEKRRKAQASVPEAPEPEAPERPVNSRQAFIEKAREVAATFIEGLPNFVCNEVVTRYLSETRVASWAVQDVISSEVVYENHKESYRNLVINGKASKKPPEESGAWSTGEFGTILANLLAPGTAADFKYVEDATITRLPASVYDYEVARPRSSWKIWVPGQYILPAYKGSVWFDKQNAHVLRIEMQAREIPPEFPRISVETAVDYEYITLGTPEKFLLPVRAEVLSCARGSNECERNVIEFRNYHKFTGESTIKYNQ